MRVLVCGGRNFANARLMHKILTSLDIDWTDSLVIEGEAPGADTLAKEWAERRGIEVLPFYAMWEKYGKAAGPIRNKQMLTEGKPDIVVAFLNMPFLDSRGTRNMVTQAQEAHVRTIIVEDW